MKGEPFRHIASHFGVSTAALQRHKRAHLPAELARATEAKSLAEADDLLGQIRSLQARTLALLSKAERKAEIRTALAAIGEARRNLELLGKVAGELQQEGTVNVYLELQGATVRILAALAPWPEARLAAARVLSE